METTLGGYEVKEEIGIGGVSSVYSGYQPELERPVALKILNPLMLDDSKAVMRFEREAKLTAKLEHPHIVPVYGYGSDKGSYYYAMRLLKGNLVERLSGQTKLDIDAIAKIVRNLAGALDYIHSYNIIHRDVNPANIQFDDFGNPFLMDFGIARLVPEDELEEEHSAPGTLKYMSPEQILGSEIMTGACDQYSLAMVALEMVLGQYPFEESDVPQLMDQILDVPFPSLRQWLQNSPDVLDAVFQRALAKKPEERFPSAYAFALALEEALRFMGKRLRVFVSYCTKNRPQMESLVKVLEEQNHFVWYDRELKNKGGQNWWSNILEQIRDCDLFAFALTPESLESIPCQMEYTYAHLLQKRILPVMIDKVNPHTLPAPLGAVQIVNFMATDARLSLSSSIDNLPPAKPLPNPLPAEPSVPVSALHKLAEQVETPGLSEDEQLLLVTKLERFLDDAGNADAAQQLLLKMQQRVGLFIAADTQIRKVLSRH